MAAEYQAGGLREVQQGLTKDASCARRALHQQLPAVLRRRHDLGRDAAPGPRGRGPPGLGLRPAPHAEPRRAAPRRPLPPPPVRGGAAGGAAGGGGGAPPLFPPPPALRNAPPPRPAAPRWGGAPRKAA